MLVETDCAELYLWHNESALLSKSEKLLLFETEIRCFCYTICDKKFNIFSGPKPDYIYIYINLVSETYISYFLI